MSRREQSWEGLLSLVVTDVLKNRGEIITRSSVSHQLMMTSAQVIETSATTTDNGPYQDFAHRTITLQDDMLTPDSNDC